MKSKQINGALRTLGMAVGGLGLLAGCATGPAPAPAAAPAPAPVAAAPVPAPSGPPVSGDVFVVLPETGRIHVFGDTKNYFDFLAHGEVAFTRTRVGAGPGGKTLVFGITDADVKSGGPSRGEIVMNAVESNQPFYAELFRDGRFFLFGDLKDLRDFTAFGEVPYSYTDIGAGPKGETIVMVMNKDSYPKGKPVDRLARFQALRAAK
jgi:hypothetical protein